MGAPGNATTPNFNYGSNSGQNSTSPFITVFMQRDPTPNDINYPVKQRWVNLENISEWLLTGYSNASGQLTAMWVVLSSGAGILSLSDNINPPGSTAVFPSSDSSIPPNNIQLTGEVLNNAGAGFFSTTVGNPSNHSIAINPMSVARWIVDPLGVNGTHTTIGAALLSAFSGETIFILPGFYTEDLILVPGVNLTAFTCDSYTPNVTIAGLTQLTAAGTVSISGIRLTTNGNFCLAIAGSAASIINCIDCEIVGTINACILNNCSSSSGSISLYNCIGDQLSAGHLLYLNAGAGAINFSYCTFNNTSGNTGVSNCSSGTVNIMYCQFSQPVSYSGTGQGSILWSNILCSSINQVALATAGTSFCSVSNSRFESGTASSVSIGSGTEVELKDCEVFSNQSSAIAITGSGTLDYSPIIFSGTADLINTTTQVPYNFGPIIQLPPVSGILSVQIMCGNGSPSGSITAPIGSLYSRTDANSATTRLYINTNGGTTWTNVTCAA